MFEDGREPKGFKMLDAYIIDRIRREQEEADQIERPRLRLNLPLIRPPRAPEPTSGEESISEGPVVIPFAPEIPLYDEETDHAA